MCQLSWDVCWTLLTFNKSQTICQNNFQPVEKQQKSTLLRQNNATSEATDLGIQMNEYPK